MEARTQRDQSLDALAALLNIDSSTLTKIEDGQVRIASVLLARVSRSLDIPLRWFFDGLPGQDVFEAPNAMRGSV